MIVQCDGGNCDTATQAAVDAANEARESITNALDSDTFAQQLQANYAAVVAALPQDEQDAVNALSVSFVVAAGVMSSPTVKVYSGRFYPVWTSIKCNNDGHEEPYMLGSFISSTLDECCGRWFGWGKDYDKCIHNSVQPDIGPKARDFATYQWYNDWSSDKYCVKDCEDESDPECGGLAGPTMNFYPTAVDCCKDNYSWIDSKLCAQKSQPGHARTNLWFVDYADGICAKDCDDSNDKACREVPSLSSSLYDSARECCKNSLPWMNLDGCEATSTHTNDGYSDLFYINHRDQKCEQDCATTDGGDCNGHPTDSTQKLYSSKEDCCKNGLVWVNTNLCMVGTAGFTDKYYVNHRVQECWKDCNNDQDPECKGNSEDSSVTLYDTKEDCCAEQLSWIGSSKCVSGDSGSGTGKFYVDWAANSYMGMCVKDCPETDPDLDCGGNAEGWESLYDSADVCCKTHLWWVARSKCTRS
jgi:hypothetical protein